MKKPTWNNLLIISIIFIAFFLRIFNLQYMEFKGDEASNSLKAAKLAEKGELPLTGLIGSTGINEPPIFIYILSLPFYITPNPVFVAGFIAVLNAFGSVLCYWIVKKYYSKRAAIIAAAFYSFNPWQILFSRKIWTVDLMAFFILVFLYFIFNAIYEKKKTHLIYALAALGFVLQLHISAAYFFIIGVAIIMRYRRAFDKRYLAIGMIIFFITFVPYAIFQINNDFMDIKAAIKVAGSGFKFHNGVFTIPLKLVSTKGFEFLFGSDYRAFKTGVIEIRILDILTMALLAFSVFYILSKKSKGRFIFLVWITAGLGYFAFNKWEILSDDTHYFTSFLPLFFIIMGAAADWLIAKFSKISTKLKYTACAALTAILLYQLLFSLHFLTFIGKSGCLDGEYGPTFSYRLKQIENTIRNMDSQEIGLKIPQIHEMACKCKRKCDIEATNFIINYLEYDYQTESE